MRIKAKDGYNVIINDLNLALEHGNGFYEVSEENFRNSNDAKILADYIEIDNSKNENKKEIKQTNVKKVNEAYILDNDENEKQTNAVVIDPNNEANLKQLKSVQNIKKEATEKKSLKNKNQEKEATKNEESTKNEEIIKNEEITKNENQNDETVKQENLHPENNNELLQVEQVKIDTDNSSIDKPNVDEESKSTKKSKKNK